MFYLEMTELSSIYLAGSDEIIKLTEDSITLSYKEKLVTIFGDNLCTASYANGEIYINGDILKIEFGDK